MHRCSAMKKMRHNKAHDKRHGEQILSKSLTCLVQISMTAKSIDSITANAAEILVPIFGQIDFRAVWIRSKLAMPSAEFWPLVLSWYSWTCWLFGQALRAKWYLAQVHLYMCLIFCVFVFGCHWNMFQIHKRDRIFVNVYEASNEPFKSPYILNERLQN